MSLCYFSLVSHCNCNALLNITAFIRFIQNLDYKKNLKKQHFDIIVGKLRISFIDAGQPGFISTLDGGLRDLSDGDMIHSVLRSVTFCTHVLNVRKDKYTTIGNR